MLSYLVYFKYLLLIYFQVVVAAETGGALGGMVRQLSIDQFENEGRRVSYGTPESATAARKLLDRQMSINSVPKKVSFPQDSKNTILYHIWVIKGIYRGVGTSFDIIAVLSCISGQHVS